LLMVFVFLKPVGQGYIRAVWYEPELVLVT
jgi:hypothetical protein